MWVVTRLLLTTVVVVALELAVVWAVANHAQNSVGPARAFAVGTGAAAVAPVATCGGSGVQQNRKDSLASAGDRVD